MKDNQKLTIRILTITVIVLVLVLAYFFLIQPGVNRFAQNNYYQGANDAYADLVRQVDQQGYFALPLGKNEAGEDQTLVLVPYVAPQGQVPAQ